MRACTLLAPTEIAAVFGVGVGPATPTDPYCRWRVGEDGFVALTIWAKPVGVLHSYPGLSVGSEPDVGDSAFWGSNKQLFFGVGTTSYSLQFERGAEWVDSNRPRLRTLALAVLDRLGFVPKPPVTTPVEPVPGEETTTTLPTTTTTRPRPAPVPPPATVAPPKGPIDLARVLSASAPLRMWAGGDSIAGGPAWAIGQAAHATGVAAAETEFQVGTGLARPDFFDWPAHLAAVADASDPDVMVLIFGGNDIQPLDLLGGGTVGWGDPRWLDEYRRRVALIMETLAVRGRHVVWIGLPPMESPAYSEQMVALNTIFSSEATRHAPWVSFLDTWDTFSKPGEPGVFARELPGPDGQPRSVRFDDIHFNVPGSEQVAAMVLRTVSTFTTLPAA